MIELCHTIKQLYLLWICKYKHVYYGYIFLGSSSFCSLETINLKIILEEAMKMHFLWVKTNSISLHFPKHDFNFDIWLSISLNVANHLERSSWTCISIPWRPYSLHFGKLVVDWMVVTSINSNQQQNIQKLGFYY